MIKEPVSYSETQLQIIKIYEDKDPKDKKGSFWANDELKEVRKHIKVHYVDQQSTRCCYCNRHQMSKHGRYWDIEHVACRNDYPHFMFEPLNLAVACVECNQYKATKDPIRKTEALKNKKRKTYPKKSEDFLIIHPHYDTLEDHIFVREMIYLGKTDKGTATIHACNLLRYAQNFIKWEGNISDERFETEVDDLINGHQTLGEAAIEILIENFKN